MRIHFQIVNVVVVALFLVCANFTMRCECVEHDAPQAEFMGIHCCGDESAPAAPASGIESDTRDCVDSPYQLTQANLTRLGQVNMPSPAPLRALPALDRWIPLASFSLLAESSAVAAVALPTLPLDRFDLARC